MPLEDFGTYKDGSSVFKDKHGYYIIWMKPTIYPRQTAVKDVEYKKYLKNWKPTKSDTRLILDKKTNTWKIVKKSKKSTKK